MRHFPLLAALTLLCACPTNPPPEKPVEVPPTSGLPAELKPPTSVERPPATGSGLPGDLKPPGQ
jgi:hypothetical protein